MNNTIEAVIVNYQKSVQTLDVEEMLSLYTDNIFMYDCWEEWSLEGKERLADMVNEWFGGIKGEYLDVEVSNLTIEQGDTVGFAYFDAKFIAKTLTGEEIRSVSNRFTLGCVKEVDWKIRHQHSSLPQ